jgi:hypothetical protein
MNPETPDLIACVAAQERRLRRHTIYRVTCVVTSQTYVGQTSMPLAARWQCHVSAAVLNRPGCRLLSAAIRSHGREAFSIEMLEEATGKTAANEAEKKWIDQLNCRAPFGLNLTRGGSGEKMPERPRLPCAVCDEPATRASSNSVHRHPHRKAYCEKHKRPYTPRGQRVPCAICNEPATARSSAMARCTGGRAYCRRHKWGNNPDRPLV